LFSLSKLVLDKGDINIFCPAVKDFAVNLPGHYNQIARSPHNRLSPNKPSYKTCPRLLKPATLIFFIAVCLSRLVSMPIFPLLAYRQELISHRIDRIFSGPVGF